MSARGAAKASIWGGVVGRCFLWVEERIGAVAVAAGPIMPLMITSGIVSA